MSITVESALKLQEMANVSIVAGISGLQREITSVNVMEVPDISKYLKRGELLVTTMYPIRDNEEMQRGLMPLLAEKGVAALALAPLHERGDVPDFMLAQAEEIGLPILKLPYETSFNDIMNAILNGIIEKRYRSGLIENILQGRISSLSHALNEGRSYGWNLKGSFIPVVVQDKLYLSLPQEVIMTDIDGSTILLFPLDNLHDAKRRTVEIITMLEAYQGVRIGIGRAIENILGLSKGFNQAEQAIKISKQAKWPGYVTCYNNLGIYRVLDSGVDHHEKQLFTNDYLGPILDDDELITTLRVYFNNKGNQRGTAKSLFVHYNTISYRITRIEQLTGLSLDCPDNCLCLQVALKLLDI